MNAMRDTFTGNWSALALRAAAAILFAIVAFALPGPTIAAIVVLFGIYAIIDGVLSLIAAVRGIRRGERWGAMMLQGILGIAAGVIAFVWPAIGAIALTYLVAAWALVTGVLEVAAAIKLRRAIKGEWLLVLGGVLSIILGLVIALFPGLGVVLLVWWMGAYAFAYGVINLALAMRVRNWMRTDARAAAPSL